MRTVRYVDPPAGYSLPSHGRVCTTPSIDYARKQHIETFSEWRSLQKIPRATRRPRLSRRSILVGGKVPLYITPKQTSHQVPPRGVNFWRSGHLCTTVSTRKRNPTYMSLRRLPRNRFAMLLPLGDFQGFYALCTVNHGLDFEE
jgi:hypothetical protein